MSNISAVFHTFPGLAKSSRAFSTLDSGAANCSRAFSVPPYTCVCLFLLLEQTVAPENEDEEQHEEHPHEEDGQVTDGEEDL